MAGMIRSVPARNVPTLRSAPPAHCGTHELERIGVGSHATDVQRAAVHLFDRAVAAHVAQRYDEAARRFLEAATGLVGEDVALLRMAAYTNAANAWANTGSMEEARTRLAALATSDVENRGALLELMQHLPVPCPTPVRRVRVRR